ncbi:UNVERIFIED_CONTAM: hypothetical protein PYX00_008362 [Menopon gallinae]|uniref:Transient receptor ion channel domain-containing protein n=1 Tax=Menopon gallinae TaxID=328185 RepID=A0AAW2HNT2_9NEOP
MHQYKDDVGPGQRNHGYSADMDDTGQYNARGHERDINTRENSQKFLGSVPDISEGKSSERDRASAACPYSGPQRKKMRDEYDMTYSGANTRSSAEELANREQGHGRKSELARNERQLEYEGMRDKRYGDGLRECGKPEREPPLDYRRTESYERRRQMEDYRDVRPDRKYLPPGTDYAIQRRDEDMAYRRKGSLQYNDIKSHVEGSFDNRMSREDSRRGQKVQGGVENAKSDIHSTPSNIQNKSSRSGYASESHRRGSGESAKTTPSKKIGSGYDALHEEMSNQCGLPVQKRDSVVLPVLEEREREFHELVAAGDVVAVRNFLCEHPRFNINCVNYQNLSALHVAVHEQNEAMVEFLLEQKALDCSDCALYAIKEGNVRIVEKIMDRMRETAPGLEFAPTSHSAHFSDDMTPIILAAQLGNYEIIDFLIKRDHRIPPVHGPYCKCEACKKDLLRFDRLRYSTMKLNQYKAICNPMYLFHVTDDPFQRAFDLCRELQDAAKVFPQFKSDYEDLWKGLRNFTVELIGCCRNAQEVEIILKKSANNFAGSITFPRLQYAIDLKQKEFVSHPFTQAVLVDAWTGDLLEWKVQSPLMQALSVFPRIPMLPVMAVMCMFLPNHRLVRKWKTPVNKMISSVASYLIFLVILFLESNLDKRNQKRGPPDSGMFWSTKKNILLPDAM